MAEQPTRRGNKQQTKQDDQKKAEALDEYILKIHPFGVLDPYTHPSWQCDGYLSYLLWWPLEFPFTLFMCIVGFFLAGYGWFKLKRTTKVTKQSLSAVANNTDSKETSKRDLISIIIACYNEAVNIELCLLYLEKYCVQPANCEIILVDGGSTDGWIEKVENGVLNKQTNNGLMSIPTRILKYEQHQCSGRGVCQNIGTREAKGEILLFLHADTILFDGYDEFVRGKISSAKNMVIGSFKFTVNRSLMNYPLVGVGCMELFARIRNDCYWLPYGDQAYFVKKRVFTHTLKGFDSNLVIMEDLVLTSRARKIAVETGNEIYIAEDKHAFCSPRRWQKNGLTKNTMWNQIVVFCYTYLKYTPEQIYKMYYGVEVPVNKNNKAVTFD